jgi:hypothetical protein
MAVSNVYLTEEEITHLAEIITINGLSRNQSWSLARRLQLWERHHGMKWVVDRLKMYMADLLGNSQAVRKNCLGEWFGNFRPLYLLSQSSSRGFRNTLRILRMYGRWEATSVTERDVKKFKDTISVSNEYYEHPYLKRLIDYPPDSLRSLAKQIVDTGVDFDRTLPLTGGFSPIYGGKLSLRREISPFDHVDATYDFPNLMYEFHDFFMEQVGIQVLEKSAYATATKVRKYDLVGQVAGLTKDRGLKVRFIANPYFILQTGMSRLKKAAELLLQTMPESSVYNQEGGVQWVHEQLVAGKSVSSVDLTSCSDLLPADPQFGILSSLFPELELDIQLFRRVSRAHWYCYGEHVSWQKGQPLGTYPSFASFTIFHILLVRLVGGNASNFRVIGDDIVISDPQLTDAVLNFYKLLGVPISWSKTLIKSTDLAEFAGRLVSKTAGKLPVFKGAPMDLKSDPLGYIRQYGRRGAKLLPKSSRHMIDFIGRMPYPIGYGNLNLRFMKAEDVLSLYSNHLPRLPVDRLPARLFKERFDDLPVSFRDRMDFVLHQDEWLDRTYQKTRELGTGYEVRLQDRLLVDHVNSWTQVSIDEVPDHVKLLHDQLNSEKVTIDYSDQVVKPASFLRRVWKTISKYFT